MSLADDLLSVADMAADLATEGDPLRALVALEMIAVILGDLASRASALEGTNVPPHWRRQDWDGQPQGNIRPLRRGDA